VPYIVLIAFVLVLVLVFGPSLWVRRVMAKYSQPADRYPGTGAELVEHLKGILGLPNLAIERTDSGDHYDPDAGAVRLTPDKHDGRSLTAITVAAHEVGHALQDRDGYAPLRWRSRLVRVTHVVERVGVGMMFGAPVLAAVTRIPATGLFALAGGFLSLGSSVLVHLVTLPTEFDASFNRALPILRDHILKPVDRRHAQRLLTAAALTYVAASLVALLNVARWWALLRRW
jgi:Zn-dependent membrane protease YugP